MGNLLSSTAAATATDKKEAPRREPHPSWMYVVSTWNVAAINNNPFEYWLSHEDPSYNTLMSDVQKFIDEPGERDVKVGHVFTDAMVNELVGAMRRAGWAKVDEAVAYYNATLKNRTIVGGFLKDPTIGDKRLASMPDRVTNTINTTAGPVYRPTVINMFDGDLGSTEAWWNQWLNFMFEKPISIANPKTKETSTTAGAAALLEPIKRSKYPAVTEEEEAMSVPLQCIAQAIFDAVLVHMLNTLLPGKWMEIKRSVCEALCEKKEAMTLDILNTRLAGTFRTANVIFLQECSANLVRLLKEHGELSDLFAVVAPAKLDAKRDQNSVILVDNFKYDVTSIREVTDDVIALIPDAAPLKPAMGDLVACEVRLRPLDVVDKARVERPRPGINLTAGRTDTEPHLLASFHGDTNGLLTPWVLKALHERRRRMGRNGRMLIGMDANTHAKGEKGKKYGVRTFLKFMRTHKTCNPPIQSCWKDQLDPVEKSGFSPEALAKHLDDLTTTYCARTFLQPQLNKAVRAEELQTAKNTDRNPKDWIVFPECDFIHSPATTQRDNTAMGFWLNVPFPTLSFPSDHASVSCELFLKGRAYQKLDEHDSSPWDVDENYTDTYATNMDPGGVEDEF